MTKLYDEIVTLVQNALIDASSVFSEDKKLAYNLAIEKETNENAKWALKQILDNAKIAEKNHSPLCDDTGIPHLILDVGEKQAISGSFLDAINCGISKGLKKLPGRPMAVLGNDKEQIDQSQGLNDDSSAIKPAPILIRKCNDNVIRLHVLMLGGGPAIRAKTYRVFHKHNVDVVIDEIVKWSIDGVSKLGCTPCTLAIGIGRSHYEASSLMLQAQVDGNYNIQSDLEQTITNRVNDAKIGPLGLGGNTSVLGTFLKVGQQRASGVRIVCVRPCCCFEPRIATVDLS